MHKNHNHKIIFLHKAKVESFNLKDMKGLPGSPVFPLKFSELGIKPQDSHSAAIEELLFYLKCVREKCAHSVISVAQNFDANWTN